MSQEQTTDPTVEVWHFKRACYMARYGSKLVGIKNEICGECEFIFTGKDVLKHYNMVGDMPITRSDVRLLFEQLDAVMAQQEQGGRV